MAGNKGLLLASPSLWKPYTPRWDIAANAALNSPPNLGTPGSAGFAQSGRYFYDKDSRMVVGGFVLGMGAGCLNGTTNIGSAFYNFLLPVPAKRQISANDTDQTADRHIGMVTMTHGVYGLGGSLTAALITADFQGTLGYGREWYGQAFAPRVELGGSFTLASQSSNAVSLFTPLDSAPNAADIQISAANGTAQQWWVSGITTSGFTVNFPSNVTGTWYWKLTMETSGFNIVHPYAPWTWGNQYDTVNGYFMYEAD